MPVYLIHFETKLHHAGHYVGYARKVGKRIALHRSGRGARILRALRECGIRWRVVRVWPAGTRILERSIKNKKNAPCFCPICSRQPWNIGGERSYKPIKRYNQDGTE